MPMFEYQCDECEATFQELVQNAQSSVACTRCGSRRVVRLFSSFAARTEGSQPGRSKPGGQWKPPAAGGSCGSGCGCH